MYGDTETIRGLARTMRAQAAALRSEAGMLLARAETTPWSGLAADAMRLRVRAQVDSLRHTASLADDAATALERHADEVDRLKALIAAIEEKVMAMVSAAKDRLGELAGLAAAVLPDPIDELLAHFDPPPSGHRDWLTVSVPGLAVGGLS
jgi:Putative T7SS secretion signal domain